MNKLKSQLESLLFISAKPMPVSQLAELTGANQSDINQVADELKKEYAEKGIQIINLGDKYQMASSPDNACLVQEYIKDETSGELSRPSLEALTIIAYRSPVNKMDLDRIRGVNCALILRNLLLRGLIESEYDDQKEDTYYTISLDFMKLLGINDIKELSDYEKLNQDDTINRMLNQ
ncbi:MAG: SMC-Scp complex subunit ScpB [bacterium]